MSEKIKFQEDKTKEQELLEYYYKEKGKYLALYNAKFNEICERKDENGYPIPRSTKIKLFKNIKRYCINCKKEGGTLFSKKEGKLICVCNAKKEKCNLNIELELGSMDLYQDLAKDYRNEISNVKNDIVLTKLNLLFNLEDEAVGIDSFQKNLENLKEYTKQLNAVSKEYGEQNMTKLPTDTGIISVTRKKAIELIQDEMKEEIKKFKKNINEYYNPNIQNKPNLLKDTINDYVNKILPYMKKIQELKYQKQNVYELDDDPDYDDGDKDTPFKKRYYSAALIIFGINFGYSKRLQLQLIN